MNDELRAYYETAGIPKTYRVKKTPRRIRTKAKPKAERDRIAEVRDYVRGRERGRCRCCRFRAGQSMHELKPRSLGGKVSRKNSVWVCGDGVNGCHGLIQRHEIGTAYIEDGAEGLVKFVAHSERAATWLRIQQHHWIESGPGASYEGD